MLKIALFRLIFRQNGSIMALILKQVQAAPWNALWRKDIDVRGAGHHGSATDTYRKLLLDNTNIL